jgi:hypothetical protein
MRASSVARGTAIFLLALIFVTVPVGVGGQDGDANPYDDVEVDFKNQLFLTGGQSTLYLSVYVDDATSTNITLEIHKYRFLSEEKDLSDVQSAPRFNKTGNYVQSFENENEIEAKVDVSDDTEWGFYAVRYTVNYTTNQGPGFLWSKGYLSGHLPTAGFTVVSDFFKNYISMPNLVPDLGDFTTPVIRPRDDGTYNFTVTNRYDATMENVALEIEIYMWATIEEAKELDRVDEPVPVFKKNKESRITETLGNITQGGSNSVRLDISTDKDTLKGTYFVRHKITFTYDGTEYSMKSRGYFTTEQWEGFDYTNLYPQLGVAGIIPDSSFSVKDPVPIWPLAVLIALCVLFGALAVVFYLAEEHGDQYPRLKKSLQYWSGKLEQRRRLMQQRLDELRREVDVPLEDDET